MMQRTMANPDTDKRILDEIIRVDKLRRSGDFNNSLPLVDVSIPPTIKIACPLISGCERLAEKCFECEHFRGIAQKSWSDSLIPWHDKYIVLCAKPQDRNLSQMVTE
jgi:hypothetical protein